MNILKRFAVQPTFLAQPVLDGLGNPAIDDKGNPVLENVVNGVGPRVLEVKGNFKMHKGWVVTTAIVDEDMRFFSVSYSGSEFVVAEDAAAKTVDDNKRAAQISALADLPSKADNAAVSIKDLKDLGII